MDSIQKLFTGKNVDMVVYVALWILVIVYIVYQGHMQRWDAVIALVVVFGFFYFSMGTFQVDLPFVLTISLLVSYIATFDSQPKGPEHFENPENEPTDATTTPEKEDDEDKKEDETKPKENEEENFEDNVNIGKTFMEAYKSLTPDQIESMTNDTKELLATQQNLMNTIKSLAPVVMQGKEMLDNFKDYFGKDGINGTMSSLKGTGDVLNSLAPALKSIQSATGAPTTEKKSA